MENLFSDPQNSTHDPPPEFYSIQLLAEGVHSSVDLSAASLTQTTTTTIVPWSLHQPSTPVDYLIASGLCLYILSVICTVIYRLYLHPLAKFPGPKIAAATYLYEFFYTARVTLDHADKIIALHKAHGPIVRINPNELSCNDSRFNLKYFGDDRKLSKDPWFYTLGPAENLFWIRDKQQHKARKARYMASLATSTPLLHRFAAQYIQSFLSTLDARANLSDKKINVSIAFRKMTNNIFRDWLLGDGSGVHAPEDCKTNATISSPPFFALWAFGRHFPSVYKLSAYIPMWVLECFVPLAANQRHLENHLQQVVQEQDASPTPKEGLFFELLRRDPNLRNKNMRAALDDFVATFWGPREAIGHSLTTVAYHLGRNTAWRQRLRAEIQSVNFDIIYAPSSKLRQLPCLSAICKEGLRLERAGGVRLVRYSQEPHFHGDMVIPAGTNISACARFYHEDESIWTDALEFKPERWMQPGIEEAAKYWQPFGTGSRTCAGKNVAIDLIHRVVANIYANYDISHQLDGRSCQQDGLLEIFPPPWSRGLEVAVDSS